MSPYTYVVPLTNGPGIVLTLWLSGHPARGHPFPAASCPGCVVVFIGDACGGPATWHAVVLSMLHPAQHVFFLIWDA